MRHCSTLSLLVISACVPAAALRLPNRQVISRRASLGALFALPSLASGYEYKQRDYGGVPAPAPAPASSSKPVCEDGQRLAPDGFGGKACVGEVKSVFKQIVGDDEPAAPKAKPEPAIKAAAPLPSTLRPLGERSRQRQCSRKLPRRSCALWAASEAAGAPRLSGGRPGL